MFHFIKKIMYHLVVPNGNRASSISLHSFTLNSRKYPGFNRVKILQMFVELSFYFVLLDTRH